MSTAVLGRAEAAAPRVRAAMLEQLQACRGLDAALLRLRVQYVADTASLWHLRVRVMQALAAERGEVQARRCLAVIDSVFRDHWPDAPVTRPAGLR